MNHLLIFIFLSFSHVAFAQDSLPKKKALNSFKLLYEYSRLAEKTALPWHFSSIEYGHKFKKSPVIMRLNYTNRFSITGLQAEVDLYPKI